MWVFFNGLGTIKARFIATDTHILVENNADVLCVFVLNEIVRVESR